MLDGIVLMVITTADDVRQDLVRRTPPDAILTPIAG